MLILLLAAVPLLSHFNEHNSYFWLHSAPYSDFLCSVLGTFSSITQEWVQINDWFRKVQCLFLLIVKGLLLPTLCFHVAFMLFVPH